MKQSRPGTTYPAPEHYANQRPYCRYTNVGEYPGSWLDWEKRGGPGTKSPPPPEGRGEPKEPVSEMKPTGKEGDSGVEDLGEQGQPKYPGGPLGTQ